MEVVINADGDVFHGCGLNLTVSQSGQTIRKLCPTLQIKSQIPAKADVTPVVDQNHFKRGVKPGEALKLALPGAPAEEPVSEAKGRKKKPAAESTAPAPKTAASSGNPAGHGPTPFHRISPASSS